MRKRIISLLLSVVLLFGVATVGLVPASAASELVASEECVELLKAMEGFAEKPYWDNSQWTVGYGTKCPDEDLERYQENGITEEEAEALLREYVDSFGKSVNSFNDKHELGLTQNQFDALLLFCYNVGNAWMFKEGSFRTAVIEGKTGNDFLYEIVQWCKAGGKVSTGLIKRRLMEANMYLNNVYSRTPPDNYCYVIYDPNGGTTDLSAQGYDSDVTATPMAVATYEGYVFAGWYTKPDGGTRVTVLDSAVRNTTLYARWTVDGEAPPADEVPEEPETMEPVTVKVTGNNVNVRKGPGTNYSVVGQVSSGKVITVTETAEGSGYTWGKFADGWIALTYTNYKEVIAQQPEEEEPPVEETQPPVEETQPPVEETQPPVQETEPPVQEPATQMGTITGSDLRIRTGPSTSYSIVGYLNKGDRVEILEQTTTGSMVWGRISKGWISMNYVKLDQKAPAEEQEPPKTETITGTVNVQEWLRVRKGPGTSYAIAGYLYPNDRVEILETKTVNGTVWGRVSKGWISLDYVILDNADSKPATVTKTITADCLRVRKGPGTGYSIVGYLYEGAKVEILETTNVSGTTWGRISNGWISMDYTK